ncbi:MAG: DUF126 domain-containing protein [Rhodospirillales bacterium]|nr:DUF126 domain-containing protein [Rhodospirillales bacterium]
MAGSVKARVLVAGRAQGVVLRLDAAVSFWGGVSPQTAEIIQHDHPNRGICISQRILLLPAMIGSSSSSAVLLELLYKKIGPKAILMTEIDAILVLGDLVAGEMGYPTIPILQVAADALQNGQAVTIEENGTIGF